VYARWSSHPNRATNATYEIVYNGGSERVTVDQTRTGGQWVYLGSYSFVSGTSGLARLSDAANGYVIADAVKWELVVP
jgi:hypothetical protein